VAETNKTTKRAHRPKTAERAAKVHGRRNPTAAIKESAETRYRRIEQQALDAETRRTDLLAVAAHDLRNPLGVVLVTTAMLAREVTGAHQAEQLAAIRRAALEMTQVIEDLVDGASIDAGTLELGREECDVLDIMHEALAAARAVASERLVAVDARIAQDLPLLNVDRHRLLHVFSRVVANALRFMPKQGSITLEATRESDAVKFSVSDSGPAVPDSQRPYAFSRRPPPGKRTCRGTGLGMFVIKGIVEAHGGRIELTSDPECGNTVSFTIPLRRGHKGAMV
jgi:signal transduction histidine kinase